MRAQGLILRIRDWAPPCGARGGIMIALAGFLVLSSLLMLCLGAVTLTPGAVMKALLNLTRDNIPAGLEESVVRLRLQRLIMAWLAGTALGCGGASTQGLFRNPLADPGVIGVSTGAALFAALAIVMGAAAGFFLSVSAFAGALLASILIAAIARRDTGNAHLVIVGVSLNALFAACLGALIFMADDAQLRSFTFWTMGSLGGASAGALPWAALFIIAGLAIQSGLRRWLNALALGEADAARLGLHLPRMRWLVSLSTALSVGAAVACTGVIGFAGLLAPHAARFLIGPDFRWSLPAAGLLGASFLALADAFARALHPPAELPLGMVTAALGAPYLLWLALKIPTGVEHA
ncbi:MAG: Vitamin B12 import system permease protein BtuC [Myxococcota bacterium]|nr:Vitamin B12 import system permease protein BtuC [Myxococcota bacterium]